jgi:cell wall assembly regulator SMI1
VHDGQERGGRPTGILFGVALLDCEEIVEEWQLWKTVAQAYVQDTASVVPPTRAANPEAPVSPLSPASPMTPATPSSSSTAAVPPRATRRQSKLFGSTQRFANSRPPDTIQPVYAHPAWIPLAKDFSGNNIAVDLSPGPRGTWGQIILFGRDCDTKYVIARSWASFLAAVADDFEAGEARFDSDEDFRESYSERQLRIRPCQGARDDSFLEVLKARVRLKEREVRRKRETMREQQRVQGGRKETVDLMVNSPLQMGGDERFPSPSLPRGSDSISGSPVIGTPLSNSTVTPPKKKDSVTVSGPEILAKEEEAKPKTVVVGGVVVEEQKVLGSPILVRKRDSGGPTVTEETIKEEEMVKGEETAKTGWGIVENGSRSSGEE